MPVFLPGFILLGPAPYVPETVLAQSLTITIVGLGFLGIGTAALLVSSFAGAQKSALASLQVKISVNSGL